MSNLNSFQFIPAIDIIDGKCVRLSQGDYSQKTTYYENPLDAAKYFEDLGVERLHLVDLDGAKSGKIINIRVLDTIANQTQLQIDFGGGVKTDDDVRMILQSGAKWVTVGSMAIKQKDTVANWLYKFGKENFLIGIDVKGRKVATDGWLNVLEIDISEIIDFYFNNGFNYFFCTDISKDGMLQGISADLYLQLLNEFKGLNLVASGGVSSIDDIHHANKIGCNGVIVGKAIYEEKIKADEIKSVLRLNFFNKTS
jgi:phosphoribosylformimino-5-aminoimidazole carboxamide ribotide isomerase